MTMLRNILWRFKCPKSVADIARHFVDTYIPNDQIATHDFETAYTDFIDPWFAYRRRIGFIYGVANNYRPPDNSTVARGWNHKLWKSHETLTPDELVETIFSTALERLQQIAAEQGSAHQYTTR